MRPRSLPEGVEGPHTGRLRPMGLSIRDVLTTWRDLERQLDRLATDDERAADIRERIAVLRGVYREMVDASYSAQAGLVSSQVTEERAREILRQHFLATWASEEAHHATAVDWQAAIEHLLREHVPEGRRCRACGPLPDGVDPVDHQATIVHDHLVHLGVVRAHPASEPPPG